jgi:Ca2+ transporting ATPase
MSEKVVLYTIVFQSFVFMQIFNQVNARKLGDLDYNVFAGFFNNFMFLFIMILTFGVQMLLVQYAGRFATVKPLTWPQQGVCFGIGSFTILWGVVIKAVIPARWFNCLAMNEKEMTEQQAEGRFMSSIKRSHSQVVRHRTGGPPRKSSKAINADCDDNFKQE